ncbi:DUF4224 domain-containing protein [Pseudoduganella sp. RAF19]|uniref:DUF4224 domain-containing protein n=1 Tax=Bacteria TaxID=2 RepID=UPI003F9B7410
MKMFLDSDEVRELTDRIQRAAQAKVLRSMGIEHRARPDGSLAVLRAHVEQVLGVGATTSRKKQSSEPNWGALDAARS